MFMGGPLFGFFARQKIWLFNARRIVGATVDVEGKRATL